MIAPSSSTTRVPYVLQLSSAGPPSHERQKGEKKKGKERKGQEKQGFAAES